MRKSAACVRSTSEADETMAELSLSPQVFSILSALVEDRVGLSYTPEDRELFASKVCDHALDAGFDSMLDYYYHLRYDDPGQQAFATLVEALLVHETFFFRELQPLQAVVERIVAPLVAAGERPRIWCAACSTGEEPLTLAMLLDARGMLDRVELCASDLSEETLARARRGVFSARALRPHAQNPLSERYLTQRGNQLVIDPRLLAAVRFSRINLVDSSEVAAFGRADVIICRNVLIYFRDARARKLVDDFTNLLARDGVLLVGVSESVLRLSTRLDCEQHAGVFLYRKNS